MSNLASMNKIDSLRDQVYAYLRDKMESGSLLPGAAVDLNEISKELSISKTPLRDAMIRLEAEGFVKIWPRRGIIVNRLDLEDIRYLYEIIGALEGAMVCSAFDKFDELVLARMDAFNAEMRTALAKDDLTAYSIAHWAFHDIFLELSQNLLVKRIITPIKHQIWEFPRRGFSREWDTMACNEHQAITTAIRNGELNEATRIIRDLHWGFSYNEKFIRRVYFYEKISQVG